MKTKKQNENVNVQVTNEAAANEQQQAAVNVQVTNEADAANEQQPNEAENVQAVVIDDERVKSTKKTIVDDNKEFRKTLEANLLVLSEQYKQIESTKKAFDYLATITKTDVNEFFRLEFVRSLYKCYTFTDADGQPYTCIAETRKKSDKTDFAKLSYRYLNSLDIVLDISKSLDEKSGLYYVPIVNFTASSSLKYLLSLDAYVVEYAKYKAAKRAEARKAKKQAKKQAKQQAAANEQQPNEAAANEQQAA